MAETDYKWPKIGNEKVIEFLERGLQNNRVAQTYVFSGADDLGKSTVALAFAANLQGQPQGFNSDLHILEPEADKKGISIEAVREFIKTLNLSSFLNSYKIGIIKQADLMSSEAKSALLKTLEEPKEKVIIILLTVDEHNLPETILSRAQILYFYPVPVATIYDYLLKNLGTNRNLAKDLSALALGRPLAALKLFENPEIYKAYLEKATGWLELMQRNAGDRLTILDKIFVDKTWSKSAVEAASGIILMAEGLARDLLLLSLDKNEHLQHAALKEELEKTLIALGANSGDGGGGLGAAGVLNQFRLLAQAKEYLAGNVNPRLVLEQIVLNF
jgi:DNA polymerase-3 subunit delta'